MNEMQNSKYSKFMHKYIEAATSEGDLQLIGIFERNKKEISEHFESSLPENNAWAKYVGPANEFHGPLFHKGFRQFDVTKSGKVDVMIWNLLAGNECPAFWDTHSSFFK